MLCVLSVHSTAFYSFATCYQLGHQVQWRVLCLALHACCWQPWHRTVYGGNSYNFPTKSGLLRDLACRRAIALCGPCGASPWDLHVAPRCLASWSRDLARWRAVAQRGHRRASPARRRGSLHNSRWIAAASRGRFRSRVRAAARRLACPRRRHGASFAHRRGSSCARATHASAAQDLGDSSG